MAGLTPGSPTPQSITVHGQSRQLELAFSDGAAFRLPFELLRVLVIAHTTRPSETFRRPLDFINA